LASEAFVDVASVSAVIVGMGTIAATAAICGSSNWLPFIDGKVAHLR
jgi:hypothetical protein